MGVVWNLFSGYLREKSECTFSASLFNYEGFNYKNFIARDFTSLPFTNPIMFVDIVNDTVTYRHVTQ